MKKTKRTKEYDSKCVPERSFGTWFWYGRPHRAEEARGTQESTWTVQWWRLRGSSNTNIARGTWPTGKRSPFKQISSKNGFIFLFYSEKGRKKRMNCTCLFTVHPTVTLCALPFFNQPWHISVSPCWTGALICWTPRTIKSSLALKWKCHSWHTDKIQNAFKILPAKCFCRPFIHLFGFTLILTIETSRAHLTAALTFPELVAAWKTGCLSDAALEQTLKRLYWLLFQGNNM